MPIEAAIYEPPTDGLPYLDCATAHIVLLRCMSPEVGPKRRFAATPQYVRY